jgi:hypothetical protein
MKLTDITQAEWTTYVGLLTIEQKDLLVGNQYAPDCYFNPIQDINDNWIISEIEYYYCLGLWYLDELNSELVFIKDLSLSVYEPKIVENPLM